MNSRFENDANKRFAPSTAHHQYAASAARRPTVAEARAVEPAPRHTADNGLLSAVGAVRRRNRPAGRFRPAGAEAGNYLR